MQNKLQHYRLYKQLDQFELAAMVRSQQEAMWKFLRNKKYSWCSEEIR